MNRTSRKNPYQARKVYRRGCALLLLALWMSAAAAGGVVQAQQGQVQELQGSLGPGEYVSYLLPGLETGQTLYVHMEGTSGNLDPAVGVSEPGLDTAALEETLQAAVDNAIAEGRDPLVANQQALEAHLLAIDDDSGGGLKAALVFPVPASGDYILIANSALSVQGRGTFGGYRLLVGLDAPEVLSGDAQPTGHTLAELDLETSPPGVVVQEIEGRLTTEGLVMDVRELRPGDTLYLYAEATSGELRPWLGLLNFADKPLQSANVGGQAAQATLQITKVGEGGTYSIMIAGCCDDDAEPGTFRLLAGINEPEVLTGQAEPRGLPIVREPIEVRIGLKLQQIVDVDAQNESFTAVGTLRLEWTDPALAFNPEDCNCVHKTYTQDNFGQFLADNEGVWPAFTLYNQQGNRWVQNQVVVVSQSGEARYLERFTTDFQVDFDFQKYPLDQQEFIIQVDSIYPEEFYRYVATEGFSEISSEHGEDEFDLGDLETEVTSVEASTLMTSSRFTFRFEAPRQVNYYVLQIFIPILLITIVSWITFFLKDYKLRIEVASGNLLLFIAFSFSLSDNYPRLGYVTLMDAIMVVMFAINALVVTYNVILRRLEVKGEGDLANRIDNVLDWLYPIGMILAALCLYLIFL